MKSTDKIKEETRALLQEWEFNPKEEPWVYRGAWQILYHYLVVSQKIPMLKDNSEARDAIFQALWPVMKRKVKVYGRLKAIARRYRFKYHQQERRAGDLQWMRCQSCTQWYPQKTFWEHPGQNENLFCPTCRAEYIREEAQLNLLDQLTTELCGDCSPKLTDHRDELTSLHKENHHV